ncbi:uncharacterized protein DS421_14g464260 [Arachis hypogaea]|nr:uncharacterized protein DS421_14g464260 [Arachis hypogaea]
MPNCCCYYFEMIWLQLRLLFMSVAFPISMDFDTLSDTGSKTPFEAAGDYRTHLRVKFMT